ncbi:anosmin-1b isoform X1 [Tachysurus ichikawai]
MFVSGVLPILLCCVVKLSVARRTGAEDGETVEKINSARCTSRCLTLHITQLTSAFRRLQSDDVLGWCENHRRCAQTSINLCFREPAVLMDSLEEAGGHAHTLLPSVNLNLDPSLPSPHVAGELQAW